MPAMMMGMFPMEVFQRPEQINITQEAFNQTRRIYMDQELPKWDEDRSRRSIGRSVGHWEGDTLVVETTGIKENVTVPLDAAFGGDEDHRAHQPDRRPTSCTTRSRSRTTTSRSRGPGRAPIARMKGYKLQEYVCEDNREYVDESGGHTLRLGGGVAAEAACATKLY